ncbi:MAG TPA: 7-carboxy-7-deazaguanine synthase QueE [Verrucomicrobiales bacterium]|nr:7-carboxy-7-deazaguanine synthase QueE [Verrucomicrobiales bacterium]
MKLARMPDGSPEIFYTIQGEGRNIGLPAVFIRSSLCNLHCRWCDTDYTWNWEGTNFAHERDGTPGYRKHRREDQILDLSAEEVAAVVATYPCSHFVFTGGEPLVQESGWNAIMAELSRNETSCRFEIETNGTLMPKEEFLSRIDQINVSPKLTNSGVAPELRYKPEVLSALAESGKADFKFVIGDKNDLEEVLTLVATLPVSPERIFLMPKALTVAELEKNQGPVATLAQEHGFRYSDRLHLRLFGAKRGT